MSLTLEDLNRSSPEQLLNGPSGLSGLYEHSDWIVMAALEQRPFSSVHAFKMALVQVLDRSSETQKLDLINAHPELTGKAQIDPSLTLDSQNEQRKAGLAYCSEEEYTALTRLNQAYKSRFGFGFILAVRGPRGLGLTRTEIIQTLERRLANPRDFELAEAIRNIHRIAEIRLNEKMNTSPLTGEMIWDWHEDLAQYSEQEGSNPPVLTVTYLSKAHRQCASHLQELMQKSGFDQVSQDAVGNVVGVYHSRSHSSIPTKTMLIGSHYDTVRNAGKYDGRLGIFCAIAAVKHLREKQSRLHFNIELVAFAEEEGQRFPATFLASSALTGQFKPEWLEQSDAQGVSLKQAMQQAGLDPSQIPSIQRDPKQYLGFLEVHIEQGPVLNALNAPLGVVTSINGSKRFVGSIKGMASHSGTTPMKTRKDAACAAAELALFMEERAAKDLDSVATMGIFEVPNGSINVVPGRVNLSLDMRAPNNAQRDALCSDILSEAERICERRGVQLELKENLSVSAAPSATTLKSHWQQAIQTLGLNVIELPSGAGHDAMKIHDILPQAMLFVRGQNAGISHNPLESTTTDDMQLAFEALMLTLESLNQEQTP
jgi:beta-ureidopropionase / N-carbamoyl-L-amino-acid hydrolase